ncbi:hypothetical protein ACM66B_003318 [Microbotryomycetes sp. NB124-2]
MILVRSGETSPEGLGSFAIHVSDDIYLARLWDMPLRIVSLMRSDHGYDAGELLSDPIPPLAHYRPCELASAVYWTELRKMVNTDDSPSRAYLQAVKSQMKQANCTVIHHTSAETSGVTTHPRTVGSPHHAPLLAEWLVEHVCVGGPPQLKDELAVLVRWGDVATENWRERKDVRTLAFSDAEKAIIRERASTNYPITLFMQNGAGNASDLINKYDVRVWDDSNDFATFCAMAACRKAVFARGNFHYLATRYKFEDKAILGCREESHCVPAGGMADSWGPG